MGKARKHLGLGLVCAAFLFLFNPTASIMDPLPDFIGYWLMCIGITHLADMNYHFEESLNYFKKMLIASAVQFFSFFVVLGMVTGKEKPTTFLLLSFLPSLCWTKLVLTLLRKSPASIFKDQT